MAERSKARGLIKFVFWAAVALVIAVFWVRSYTSGQMVKWYYHSAKTDGYAINSTVVATATKDKPIALDIGKFDSIEGLKAVPVKKGDRLPAHANGIIDEKTIKEGKRAAVSEDKLAVFIPWQIKEAKGFKFKDTFTHKGVKTNPWAAVWNVCAVIFLGVALGSMAEGFTDLIGIKVTKLIHHGH